MNDKQLIELSINCNKLCWQVERFRTLLTVLGKEIFQDQYDELLHDLNTEISMWNSTVSIAVDQGFELNKRLVDNVE